MNNRIEACVNCQKQCELVDGAKKIIENVKNGSVTGLVAKQEMSVLSQKANRELKCPNSEIQNERKKIAEQIGDPALLRIINNAISVKGPFIPLEDRPYFPRSPGKRQTYIQYMYRLRSRRK
jgi:hypothetical protein